jgi:hypothetical protein
MHQKDTTNGKVMQLISQNIAKISTKNIVHAKIHNLVDVL